MQTADFDLNDPRFLRRARAVREALDDGEPMTLGDIADRLGLTFECFMHHLASEMLRQAPGLGGVMVFDVEEVTLQ